MGVDRLDCSGGSSTIDQSINQSVSQSARWEDAFPVQPKPVSMLPIVTTTTTLTTISSSMSASHRDHGGTTRVRWAPIPSVTMDGSKSLAPGD